MAQPMMTISGSEPSFITDHLLDIGVIDHNQQWPDYRIYSVNGYTIDIFRASVNDLLSNKLSTHSHIANELSRSNGDIKIFLQEDYLGMNDHNDVSTIFKGLNTNNKRNYTSVINTILSACIANNALWVPSANHYATVQLLRGWNTYYFQQSNHLSLQLRPEKVAKVFSLDINETSDKIWWLSDIPGINIGYSRARNSIMKYKSLMRLFMQSPQTLQKDIPLWGEETAMKFRAFLDDES